MFSAAIMGLVLGQTASTEVRLIRDPAIHGDTLVFRYASDLWLGEKDGGIARRLTSHPGTEGSVHFSPDGTMLAFTASYDGNPDVYVMPTEGGEPKRLTFEPTSDVAVGWTPDGKVAYVSSKGQAFTNALYLIDTDGGMPEPTPVKEATQVSFSPDGSKIAYTRSASYQFNWRRYRGGTQGRIGFFDFDELSYDEIPSDREQSYHPMWVGDDVYYISDRDLNTLNLFKYDTGSGDIERLTDYRDADIRFPSTDGETIVFEHDGRLKAYDIETEAIETLDPRVIGDNFQLRPRFRSLGAQLDSLSLSPSGKRVAIGARGDLFSVPATNGDTRPLSTGSEARDQGVSWSPDGQTIAFLSDRSGEDRIYTMPQMGGDATLVATPPTHRIESFRWMPESDGFVYETRAAELVHFDLDSGRARTVFEDPYGGVVGYDISPEGDWIAYIKTEPNLFGALYLYDVSRRRSTKVTEGYFRDDSVAFDLNGKYLYLISARTFAPDFGEFEIMLNMAEAQRVYVMTLQADTPNPLLPEVDEEPVVEPAPAESEEPAQAEAAAPAEAEEGLQIDFEGMEDRVVALPWPAASYQAIIGINNGVLAFSGGALLRYDFASRQPATIVQGANAISFNADRSKMAYRIGTNLAIDNVRPGLNGQAGRVDLSGVAATVDPRAEWRQIFWEAWRYQRDVFYDPELLGLDWMAIGRQYEAQLEFVNHREDLNYVIGQMIGELGTGHAYNGGGEFAGAPSSPPTGMLGADYRVEGDYVRFDRIYRGLNFESSRRGPLGELGVDVEEGDYLLAIDGKPVRSDMNLHAHLVGTVGRSVTLTVNDSPSEFGARTVRVRPVASEGDLRYITWVEDNRAKVSEMSDGRIGYIHMPDTSIGGVIEFIKGFYSQSDKEAWVIDERYNGGGFIPTFFIEFLQRTYNSALQARDFEPIGFPTQSLDGPKVMLINEYAGSGGDMLPWLFRKTGLGPLVGKRTWGGLVGIQGSLGHVDGGFVTSPGFGIFDPDTGEWIAENTGIDPDVDIDADPALVARGQDPQLDYAVNWLLDRLDEGAGREPFRVPDYPRAPQN